MESVEPPFARGGKIEIHADQVCPHHLASIGRDKTVFDQMLGPNESMNKGPRRSPHS